MILERPNCLGQVKIVLVGSKSFWSDLNHFDQVKIRLFWTNFYNLDLSKMILMVQNHFGTMEGQGINVIHQF